MKVKIFVKSAILDSGKKQTLGNTWKIAITNSKMRPKVSEEGRNSCKM